MKNELKNSEEKMLPNNEKYARLRKETPSRLKECSPNMPSTSLKPQIKNQLKKKRKTKAKRKVSIERLSDFKRKADQEVELFRPVTAR